VHVYEILTILVKKNCVKIINININININIIIIIIIIIISSLIVFVR